ncbi:feruloyl-CoA synthase [Capillimicrobium parvum]|uniref:Long-chain-fatty-acid--CoA ligase FadD15 n=1 Tax=Capillimicrobium parvum TaxID=2884022 RepID=A0A9E7C0I2_9ACTN|nr:feruloyl-CoA synthase [Capillimicrobium parvum]UGS35562.1 Long-chain-fatty-acid--CoA ligase FadD15 [Capillimicrobium parvum]
MAVSPTATPLFATPRILAEERPDGTLILRSADPLGAYPPSLVHAFRAQSEAHPDRVFAAERAPGAEPWTTLTWGDARTRADGVAQALLDRGLGADRPLMILSGNSLAHLVMALGALTAGVPVLPVSVAYSLMSKDHRRLRQIVELCEPAMVFAADADPFAAALGAVSDRVAQQVAGLDAFADLAATEPGPDVERAVAALGPDTVAKILFTSGSTGAPKGVINTHRMLCSNQQSLGQIWPFLHHEPPVLVDWLPWSHTFGGNHNLNQTIAFGGTLYIDDGKPAPALFPRTVSALRDVSPTVYYNVPAGFALLAGALEADADLARRFFARLRFMFYAAAALPPAVWERMRALADEHADHPVPLTASWGTTETAPGATSAHFPDSVCGCIGVPIPGVTLKLTPAGEKREVRVKGPNVTPGYHRDPDATARAFDEEGFYLTGDAVRLADPADPAQGLMFDGRLAEDFKLVTGTWVTVGRLRTQLVSTAGVLTDAVICGQDRDAVAALAWVNQAEARRVCGGADDDVALDDPTLCAHLAARLAALNDGAGSASRIERLLLLAEPPSIDAGEITDKGYINQRIVLERRADHVARLYAEPLDAAVIVPAS